MTDDLEDTVLVTAPPLRGAPAPDDADTVLRRGAPAGPRPPVVPSRRLGFRIGEGAAVPLEVPSLLGRRPRRPRVPSARPPRLVTVASPAGLISATHLELRQHGESAVVTDLGSTNGTSVQPAQGPSRLLRQGESLVVEPGDVIDLGEGVRAQIVLLGQGAPA